MNLRCLPGRALSPGRQLAKQPSYLLNEYRETTLSNGYAAPVEEE